MEAKHYTHSPILIENEYLSYLPLGKIIKDNNYTKNLRIPARPTIERTETRPNLGLAKIQGNQI